MSEQPKKSVEQHEAAPCNALTDLVESYGRALLAQRTDEAAAILDCIRRSDASPSAPLEGTGNGAIVERLRLLMSGDPMLCKTNLARATLGQAIDALSRTPRTEVAGAVPEGWTLVPVEPTEKMISEGSCAQSLPGPHYISEAAAKACWKHMIAATPPSADAAAEDKYVIERLSTVLAGVAAALLGEEADRPAAETLQKLPEEAAKLRLELDLYRAQAADAAAAPADERAQCIEWATANGFTKYHESMCAAWEERARRAIASQPAAAAGQEAEPFGWAQPRGGNYFTRNKSSADRIGGLIPVYTAPPAQVATRQGLTDERIEAMANACGLHGARKAVVQCVRALLEGAKQ
ncbi:MULTISPECIES: hypothetical protein [Burkholderia]|uniref:hypothetical protein n=1 Tax=Burkholderia TaxID=32008 RepID=UPI000DC3D207|nr:MULTISPECIES: hypothetical protein [Burkholderia]MDP9548787.1 hypothetical protein [Burkholderia cepacia]MBR8471207.1 hypothetical protein [Burkholderia cenocepacia]MDP9598903.1 hypothetical protein [Burkholderia cepacia]MDP9626963.1 hypothetical protein [Burkholderia cepacia]MDP9672913.1 hypothetical protein [Burkholderia cepacia]